MIIKSISHTSHRASIKNLIAYVFSDKDLKNKDGESVTVSNLLRGGRESWAKQFQRVEARRRSFYGGKEVRLYHEILSFHPGSKPSKKELEDLIWKYIQLRTDNKPVLAFAGVHFSESHYHAHIVFSGIDMYGVSIRQSKSDFRDKVQVRLNDYQQKHYLHLSDSIIDYSKASKEPYKLHSHNSWQRKKRTKQAPRKERARDMVQSVFVKSNSVEAFIANLALRDIDVYYYRDKLNGIIFEGQKIRLKKSLGVDFDLLLKPDLQQARLDRIKKLKEGRENDKNKER
jgi:hypothetical protein